MALPPVFAASALYDSLLQAALRQFFSRATFETEPIPSLSSDGRLAIEPTNDPSVLTIRWFGSRYVLHVPARRPFTPHEVRLAQVDRRRAGAALSRDLRSEADARAHGAVPRRDRRPLHQRVPRRAGARPTGAAARPICSPRRSKCCASRRFELRESTRSRPACCCSTGTTIASTACRPRRTGLPLLAGADRHQELLPHVRRHQHAVPGQPPGFRARHRRRRPLRPGDPARSALPDGVSRARARHRRQPEDLHRAQPVARDQGVRAGRRRCSASATRGGTCSTSRRSTTCGRRPSATSAGRAAVPDRDRSRRRTAGRAVRGPSRTRRRRSRRWSPRPTSSTRRTARRAKRRRAAR